MLLTGNACEAAESDMLAVSRPLSPVVYKAGHHGSKSSSSVAFLEAVRLRYVIVSAGGGNRLSIHIRRCCGEQPTSWALLK